MSADLAFMPAVEVAQNVREKKISSLEATENFFQRIDRLDSQLNSYITLCQDQALADARAADDAVQRGSNLGPLHGVPISIKDLELTRGVTTTMGSALFSDRVPDMDSIVVERVKASGAIILGKTNTPEFGQSGTTENKVGEPCRNPWNTERTPGGSSGGAAAALAAGLCTLSMGTDGGGSIRIPASFTGVYGIKPTQGRVPRYGGYGRPSANHFSQSGPITRTVADSALLLQVVAGYDTRDVNSLRQAAPDFSANLGAGVKGMRLAWSSDYGFAAVDPEVVEITERSAKQFSGLGANIEDAGLKLEDPFDAFWDVFATAAYTSYGHLLDEHRDDFSDYGLKSLLHGQSRTGADMSRAIYEIDRLGRRMEEFFDEFDLLLTPTMAVPAFPIEQRPSVIGGRKVEPFWGFLPFTYLINITGQTAASIPCGYSEDGMPIGLHIIGPRGSEAKVLQASAAFEQAQPWAGKRPGVC
ncbi:MAG: amidase [Chloroflexota bacterium]|uniref:Amidase domain-containing protein n=1 Tax=marine metagenome TaxID=408172 RepID=A0A381RMV0_9ZZZZ|nr:amidase [Chloroflexota bacterium]